MRGERLVRCGGEGVEVVCGELGATTGFCLRIISEFFCEGGLGLAGAGRGWEEGEACPPPHAGELRGSWQRAFLPLCHFPRWGSVGS